MERSYSAMVQVFSDSNMLNIIMMGTGMESDIPMCIAFGKRPEKYVQDPSLSDGKLRIRRITINSEYLIPSRDPIFRLRRFTIKDIMTGRECIHLMEYLSNSVSTVTLAKWYDSIDMKYDKPRSMFNIWKKFPHFNPTSTFEECLWFYDRSPIPISQALIRIKKSGRPSGESGINWLAFHYGLLRIEQVEMDPNNVLRASRNGLYNTARTFSRRGDAKGIDFKMDMFTTVPQLNFLRSEGLIEPTKVKWEDICTDNVTLCKWLILHGMSFIDYFVRGSTDRMYEFAMQYLDVLSNKDVAAFLTRRFTDVYSTEDRLEMVRILKDCKMLKRILMLGSSLKDSLLGSINFVLRSGLASLLQQEILELELSTLKEERGSEEEILRIIDRYESQDETMEVDEVEG